MKKIFLFIIILLNFINGYSQQDDSLLVDGYYMGFTKDSTNIDYYMFLKYINNIDDKVIIVLPYKYNNDKNKMMSIVQDKLLYLSSIDDYESYLMLEDKWTITGFDNFPYFTLHDNILIFSLNIAYLDLEKIEIFNFNGKVSDDKKTIISKISSNRKTFIEQEVEFKYINYEKYQ